MRLLGIAAAVIALLLMGCTAGTQPDNKSAENKTEGCVCTAIYKPVCGVDGKTYGNACTAGCAKVQIAYEGECEATGRDCQDSDGGKDVMLKGTAVAGGAAYIDGCADGGRVSEYYCEGGEAQVEAVSCPQGYSCKDGVCEKMEGAPPPPPGCSDGDGGKDFYVAATVTSGGAEYIDICTDLKLVKEYFCQEGLAANEIHQCDSGERCENGRCVKLERSCSDSDEGMDIYKKGTVNAGTIVNPVTRVDSCVDGETVKEYYCVGDDYASENKACPSDHVCENGRCEEAECEDSDGGKDYGTQGNVTKGSESKTDSCATPSSVKEYYCDNGDIESEVYECPGGICTQGGICV